MRRTVPLMFSGLMLVATFLHGAWAQRAPTPPASHGVVDDSGVPHPRGEELAEETTTDTTPLDGGLGLGAVRVVMVDGGENRVATGQGVSITAEDFYRAIVDAPETVQRMMAQDPARMQELLDRLVADQLLVAEARRRGLERDPAVRAAIERALIARLRATAVHSQSDAQEVTEADVRAWYDNHPQRFHIPERRRAWAVFVTDRRVAEEVLFQARPDVRPVRRGRRVPRAVPFRQLAQRHNTDPELLRTDGELPEVTAITTDVDQGVRDAVMGMPNTGEVYPDVIAGSLRGVRGYYVVRYSARRAAVERTLAESADWIRQRIVLERRVAAERALIDRLSASARVTRVAPARVVQVLIEDAGIEGGVPPLNARQ